MNKKEIAETLNKELKVYYEKAYDDSYYMLDEELGYEASDIYKNDKGYYVVIYGEAVYIGNNQQEIYSKVHNNYYADELLEKMLIN